MTDAVASFDDAEPRSEEGTTGSYLDSQGRGFAEWLLTTDHKRIALLYAADDHGVLLHRRRGGDADPARALLADPALPDRRRLQPRVHAARRHHGVVLPRAPHPDDVRQLPAAADDRRAGRRLSEAQSRELVSDPDRRIAGAGRDGHGRRRYRVDLLSALFDVLLPQQRRARSGGGDRRRLRHDRDRRQFRRHHAHAARAGHDLVPSAAVRLVDLRDEPRHGAGDAGAGDDARARRRGPLVRPAGVRRFSRRRSAAVPASLLVLLPSRRLHHDPAGDRAWSRRSSPASPAGACSATRRWSTRSWRSPSSASPSGATTCSCPASRRSPISSSRSSPSSSPSRRRSRCSTGRRRSIAARSRSKRRCSTRSASSACSPSAA